MIVIFDRKKIMKDANAWRDLMEIREMEKRVAQGVLPHANAAAEPKRSVSILFTEKHDEVFSKNEADAEKLQKVKGELHNYLSYR